MAGRTYRYAGACAAVSLVLLGGVAWAELDEALPPTVEGLAFDAADSDGDGRISEAELARDAAAGFTGLDADGDGVLSPDELGPHDAAAFDRVDTDGDGVLSFDEVMENKLRGLKAADSDGDGALSFEEMRSGAAAEQGVTP